MFTFTPKGTIEPTRELVFFIDIRNCFFVGEKLSMNFRRNYVADVVRKEESSKNGMVMKIMKYLEEVVASLLFGNFVI